MLYLYTKVPQTAVLKTEIPMLTCRASFIEPNILNLTITNIGNISYRITKVILLDHHKNLITQDENLLIHPGEEISISFRINPIAHLIKNNTYPILIVTHRGIVYTHVVMNRTVIVLPLESDSNNGIMFIPHLYDWYFIGDGYIFVDFPVSDEVTVIVSYNHESGIGQGIVSRYSWGIGDPKRGAFDILINVKGTPQVLVTNGSSTGLISIKLDRTGFIALVVRSREIIEVFDGVKWIQRSFHYNLSKNYYPIYIGRSHYVNPKDPKVETYFKGRIRYVILDVNSWSKHAIEALIKEFKVIKHPTLFLDPILCNNTICYDVYFNKTFTISKHNAILKLTDEIFIWGIQLPGEKVLSFTHFPIGTKVYLFYSKACNASIRQLEFIDEHPITINTTILSNTDTVVFIIP